MNTKYEKMKEDHTLEYAPSVLDGFYNPSDARYRAHGYMPVVDNPAPSDAPSGKHYEFRSYELADSEIRRAYVLVDDPPASPRTFSKYKLVSALIAADVWPQVKAWIESVPGAYDLYLAAEDISEDEPLLAQGIAAVKELLGWTDKQVEALLAKCVKE